jgi:signal transduction histidine kinase
MYYGLKSRINFPFNAMMLLMQMAVLRSGTGRQKTVLSFLLKVRLPISSIPVRDNGIGFPQEDAERIFNVFTRLHGNSEYRGTGVGLSIVQKVVDNHHGYIWAESTPGEGATFRILLPAE